MRNHRIGRRILLICLMTLTSLLATGCENFTLVGAVNLGNDVAGQQQPDASTSEIGPSNSEENDTTLCWPSAAAAFAEMRAHGFTPKKWPNVEAWFRRLEPLAESLPPCD